MTNQESIIKKRFERYDLTSDEISDISEIFDLFFRMIHRRHVDSEIEEHQIRSITDTVDSSVKNVINIMAVLT